MVFEKDNLSIFKIGKPVEKKILAILVKIKNEILKNKYTLEINYINTKLAKELNIKHRNKDYTPNILSFSLSKTSGQIFICPSVIRKEAKNFDLSCDNFLLFLIVHGCLHLKGMEHGEKMEALEQKIFQKYVLK